jgi:hypothetical protein
MNGDKRYHAEVKITPEGRSATITVSADSLSEVLQDIGIICSEYAPGWKNPAKSDITNPEQKPAQPAKHPAPKAPAKVQGTGAAPVCDTCGSSEAMELIEFADKKTGKPRKAWKCQQCDKWHWPNGKKGQ